MHAFVYVYVYVCEGAILSMCYGPSVIDYLAIDFVVSDYFEYCH